MAEIKNLAINLQKEIERQRNNSFLQNATELRSQQDADNVRSVEILNDYARRQQLSNNIQGLIPTPRPRTPGNQFNPTSLAVVPGALKYLRRRAAENKQKFTKPENPITEHPIASSDGAGFGFTSRRDYGDILHKDKLLIKNNKPVGLLDTKLKSKDTPKRYKLGDENLDYHDFSAARDELAQNMDRRNQKREYGEYESIAPLYERNFKRTDLPKFIQLDVNSPEYLRNNSSKNVKAFNQRGLSPEIFTEKVGNERFQKAANSQGLRTVKEMLPILKSLYPEATEVSGERVSGAKVKFRKPDAIQTIKLPNLTESEMLKHLGKYKKPLHKHISDKIEQLGNSKYLTNKNE